MDVWAEIEAERKEFVGLLEGMGEDQWDAPTLCAEWRVRDVVGHLIGATQSSVPGVLVGMLSKGFRINRFLADDAIRRGSATPADLLEQFREAVPSRRLPPGVKPVLELVDTVVHQQDVRRPLGTPREIPPDRLRTVADAVKGLRFGLGAKQRIRGLRLEAIDADWSTGDGPEVAGPLEALVMAMAGRRPAVDDLEGEGRETLATRF